MMHSQVCTRRKSPRMARSELLGVFFPCGPIWGLVEAQKAVISQISGTDSVNSTRKGVFLVFVGGPGGWLSPWHLRGGQQLFCKEITRWRIHQIKRFRGMERCEKCSERLFFRVSFQEVKALEEVVSQDRVSELFFPISTKGISSAVHGRGEWIQTLSTGPGNQILAHVRLKQPLFPFYFSYVSMGALPYLVQAADGALRQ